MNDFGIETKIENQECMTKNSKPLFSFSSSRNTNKKQQKLLTIIKKNSSKKKIKAYSGDINLILNQTNPAEIGKNINTQSIGLYRLCLSFLSILNFKYLFSYSAMNVSIYPDPSPGFKILNTEEEIYAKIAKK
ncbi:hypothetical protein BpHYR1_006836 [Brachionus plicatilis]|uniref:Uncharacterized protein n=1 Tax=Brachionus plicatilis TaxID=10195 RepID=A0A3M7PHH1_BRAPC|nr:hypothetical protein BpHYR1_006836 [Brachionus plicatilis]